MRTTGERKQRARWLPARAIVFPVALYATDAVAQDKMSDATVLDTVLYWGGDFSSARSGWDGYGAGAGFVTALNGDIGASDWLFTSSIGYSRTDNPFSDSRSLYGRFLLGYQWQDLNSYFSLSAGAHYVANDENPPGSAADGVELGAVAQYSFETKSVDTLYLQSFGSFSTAFHQVYVQARAGFRTPALSFGPEFIAFDDRGGEATLRYGAFLGHIPVFDKVRMVVSAGYQDELDPAQPDGFYATVGFSVPLSIR